MQPRSAQALFTAPETPPVKVTDILSRDEVRQFTERSNSQAAKAVLFNWVFIAAIFAGVAWWPNPLSVLAAIALLGGRQLACAALMHDCGHRALFASNRANAVVGQWLCAYPILSDQPRYMKGHWKHHALAGTAEDPDLPNYRSYPISTASLRRKIVRDLTGQTGWKALRATWRRGRAALWKAPWNGNALLGHLLVNGVMFAVLLAVGHGRLYLMWPAAYLTTYMLIARLRQVAEHGAVPDLYDLDPRKNTRTTYVRPWERLFLAPYNLNHHLEHHFLAAVPCYRLKAFHHFLKARGFYEGTDFPRGYYHLFTRVATT
jgi:fatty acid desaturase